MSVVASYFSSASSTSGHARFASTMDSIFAIGLGLTLRLVVDVVSHHDLRLGGTLVGLWEGVVMLHFLKKMPSSFDPYVAYGVRLFVDFLFTENIARMVVVLLWTGMGMVLADVMPILWYDTGLQGVWNRILRDLFLLSLSLPALPSFGKNSIASRVRFGEMPSLSRASSLFTTVRSAPSIASTSPPSPTVSEPPALQIQNSRGVPGSFPGYWSETETELGSALDHPPHYPSETADNPGAAHGILPEANPLDESATEASTEQIDLDAGNISSSAWSSSSDTTDPSASNPSEIPDLEEGFEEEKGEHSDRDRTPKQIPIVLPPTPTDSAREVEDGDHTVHDEIQPPLGEVPTIPDHIESEIGEGWETVEMDDAVPPPLPSKDDLDMPPPTGDADVPPPLEGAADADAASSVEKPTVPSEQTVVPPPTTDNAPPPAADEKAPSAPPRDTRTPPPSFEDVYAEDHPDDKPSSPPPDAEPVNDPDKELPDPPIPNPPSPTTTNHESIHSLPSSSRLEQALALRKSAAALEKQLKQIEAERKDAVKEGNTALAIVKKVELEKVANEAKLHHKRAERRIFPVYNPSIPSDKIDLKDLKPEEAVRRTEEMLEQLLRHDQSATELHVTTSQGNGGISVKRTVFAAMKEHNLNVTEDRYHSHKFVISLPRTAEL